MERPGRCRALFGGEGLTDAEPREREFHGGHRGAEPIGGGAFLLRDGLLRHGPLEEKLLDLCKG